MREIGKIAVGMLVTIMLVLHMTPLADSLKNTSLNEIGEDNTPPTIDIVNPTEGYFHFSGIKLFPTQLDIVADTRGLGGFRVKPVQVQVTDNADAPQDISVYMYV